MKKLSMLIVVVFSLLLTACDQHESEYYYFQHPKALGNLVMKCRANGSTGTSLSCDAVYKYVVNLTQLMDEFRANQQAFGQVILRTQVKLMDLVAQLIAAKQAGDNAKVDELGGQIGALQTIIDKRRAVVGIFVRP